MSIGAADILGTLLSHAKVIGSIEAARLGEFKSAPPSGVCFAVWVENLGTAPGGHGLATTTGMLSFTARLYKRLKMDKGDDDAELKLTRAADLYLDRLNGDLTLGAIARNVDMLGEMGEPMQWDFGYLQIDSDIHRTADLPGRVIVNDAWTQAE